jgi:hypothetical protein
MKSVKFYSENEINTLREEIRAGVSSTKIAKKYAELWQRSEPSITMKVCKMMKESDTKVKKGRPVGSKTKKAAKIVTQSSDKGITLKNGFVFDFKPQRAEMYQDHVRIYF